MTLLEEQVPFSKSSIWQYQREYFDTTGVAAWSKEIIPHYVTNNPFMGKTYAELTLAILHDLSANNKNEETVYVLELGAGHGRLCYHFFKHFEKHYSASGISLPNFCYILSDFTPATLNFWQEHPRLQPYFDKGWIDIARVDAMKEYDEIPLEYSGKILKKGQLNQPLLVIANYFFDSIPSDLFKVAKGQYHEVLVNLHRENQTLECGEDENFDLKLSYQYGNEITPEKLELKHKFLSAYHELEDTHVLHPTAGIHCIENLKQFSINGLILLTSDKGDHLLSGLDHCGLPQLVSHGSFSLSVNYHAFKWHCEQQGGVALFQRHPYQTINVGCLLYTSSAKQYNHVHRTFNLFVNEHGPDDYFTLKKSIEKNTQTLSVQDILCFLRYSLYDSHSYQRIQSHLLEILPSASENQLNYLYTIIPMLWDTYFPLGKEENFSEDLGDLLLALECYKEAKSYYEKSFRINGNSNEISLKIAVCECMIGDFSSAKRLINQMKEQNYHIDGLQELIEEFSQELAKD